MKTNATWTYPTEIRIGRGRIEELGAVCRQLGMTRPLMVTNKGLASMAITRGARLALKEAGLDHALFSEIDSNPSDRNLEAALLLCRQGGHDGVVAFGGGSAMDIGKCLAVMAGQARSLWSYVDSPEGLKAADERVILPLVAVPTTAGTGAEVGAASVITNTATEMRTYVSHPRMMPDVVICDPELTVGMPKTITAGTGMDAFSHCLEAYCARTYHPMAQGIAVEGMRLVKDFLPKAYTDPVDLEARLNMMSASIMGAIARQKGLGAIHALSNAIGVFHPIHHGTANAVLMPMVVAFNRKAIEHKIERLAGYLEIPGGFDGFYQFLLDFRTSLAIPRDLSELGLVGDDIDRLTPIILRDQNAANNPVRLTEESVIELLTGCY